MKKFLFFCFVISVQLSGFAQSGKGLSSESAEACTKDVVLEVAGEKILKDDFVRMFKKNSMSKDSLISRSELDEYLELFINYKMKLAQAREFGLDTLKSYIDETNQYRQQLVAPYLNDATVSRQLVEEAYEREKEIVAASHILISIPANATPKDTLAAYNKALKIRERILKGEDFETVAKEMSDDPSAKDRIDEKTNGKIKGNGGKLGYFTSMNMIYPFETACYSMKAGDVSMPVRTRFGYHIIKLTDRTPAFCSSMDIKHIWVSFDKHSESEAEETINKIWQELRDGAKFDTMALLYSDDKYSSANGGILKNQTITSLPESYICQLKNLQPLELSKPFKSDIGWHIVLPLTYKPLPSFEQQKAAIEERIAKDERSFKTIESFAEKSKQEYGFKEQKDLLSNIVKIMTDSVFFATWQVPENFDNTEELFRIGDYSYTVLDFAKEIEANQKKQTPEYIPEFVEKAYSDVVLEQVVRYADSKLEEKYPELKATIDEFRDGVLIFAITDKMVWNKSIADTAGLAAFYEQNKAKYLWDTRVSATLWSVEGEHNPQKLAKILKKATKKHWDNEKTKAKIAKAFKIDQEAADKRITYHWGKFENGDNQIVNRTIWCDTSSLKSNNVIIDSVSTKRNIAVVFHQFVPEEIKTLDECKGMATSDFQSYLEKQWIRDLRNKYEYKVCQEVYDSIK